MMRETVEQFETRMKNMRKMAEDHLLDGRRVTVVYDEKACGKTGIVKSCYRTALDKIKVTIQMDDKSGRHEFDLGQISLSIPQNMARRDGDILYVSVYKNKMFLANGITGEILAEASCVPYDEFNQVTGIKLLLNKAFKMGLPM